MKDHRTTGVLLGVAIVIGALFAPWYALELGPAARATITAQTGQLPAVAGQFAQGVLSLLPDRIPIDGWTAFDHLDIVLTCLAIGAGIATLLDRNDLATTAGFAAGGATVLAMIDRPLPSEFLSLQWGAWLSLAGAVLIVVASRLTPAEAPRPEQLDWRTLAAQPPAPWLDEAASSSGPPRT